MKTHVNFKIAKLLKNKGFDEQCKYCYERALTTQIDPESNEPSGPFGWEKGETNLQSGFFVNNYDGIDFSNDNWYICSAPTIAQVVMWLYEKHGIWIEVKSPDCKDINWYFSIHKPYKFGNHYNGKEIYYNSPTEAYSAAIEYCLTKLL